MDRSSLNNSSLWDEYCRHFGIDGSVPPSDQFGDTPELADELLALVMQGQKQATCELQRWFQFHNQPIPVVGDHWIILDGSGIERCIVQTTRVDFCTVAEVDADFAWDEGEGDRSLAFWKNAHDSYFERQAARDGFIYSDSMTCICERFELVWPM